MALKLGLTSEILYFVRTWYMLLSGVRLSVTCRSSIETAEWIDLVFGVEAPLGLSYSVLEGNLGISKTGVLSTGTLFQT